MLEQVLFKCSLTIALWMLRSRMFCILYTGYIMSVVYRKYNKTMILQPQTKILLFFFKKRQSDLGNGPYCVFGVV